MCDLIFLIGFRAVGKTTIGKDLASQLGFEFVDTDSLVCRKKNASVREIVNLSGWEEFRRCEEAALFTAAQGHRRVVATGGGAILHRSFWEGMQQQAFIVWLNADRDTLAERITRDRESDELRPSLTGKDICLEIDIVLAERNPLYRQTAHLEVNTGALTIAEAVETIQRRFTEKMSNWRKE